MGLFDKLREPVVLKEDSSAKKTTLTSHPRHAIMIKKRGDPT